MQILFKDGSFIDYGLLLSATLRTDLVPVPVTLEFSVKANATLKQKIVVGAEVFITDKQIPIKIVDVRSLGNQTVKDGERVEGIAAIGVLSGCELLIERTNKAVIQYETSFSAAMRACGCKSAFGKDLPLPKFVLFRGHLPTDEIAIRAQEEAAVICYRDGKLNALRIDQILSQEPIISLDPSAVVFKDSPLLEKKQTPSFITIAKDGFTVEGELNERKPSAFRALADSRITKNLEKVLLTRATILRPLDLSLLAGTTVQVGDRKMAILTSAHRVDTGALGGASVMASKLWLAESSV